MAANPQVRVLKGMIWTYLVLLLVEGALRKWIFPGLSTPILIIRDPLVILIYMTAASCRRFVMNTYVIASMLLAMACFVGSLMVPSTNIFVTLIGLRCYFLHLPLIFVMEKTLDAEDIWRMGKFLLWFAIPETVLLVLQFYSPQGARVNFSVGGTVTAGMSGALERFRPSGTFSFTTGVAEFYPLVLAMLMGFLLARRKLPLYLSVAAAVSIVISVPFSISRTNALSCALVLVAAAWAMFRMPKPPKMVMRAILIAAVCTAIVSSLHFFDAGVDAFKSRWVDSTGNDVNGFQTAIIGRVLESMSLPLDLIFGTSLFGAGVGFGTLMAQGFLTGERQFIIGESEWPRVVLEMGPVLGLSFIMLRVAICVRLTQVSFKALRQQNTLPILLLVEALLLTLNAQWAQPTVLGFATFCAGLTFAASRMTVKAYVPIPAKRRYRYSRRPSWGPSVPESEPVARFPASRSST